MSIFGLPFGFPFSTASSTVTSEVPIPWPVALDGRPMTIDLRYYAWGFEDVLREARDYSEEPSEASLSTAGVWKRVRADWSLGAGLLYSDVFGGPVTERRRFYSSKGIDPWTERAMTLLPDTELFEASTDTNLKILPVGGYFYKVEGSTIQRTADPMAASVSWTTITGTSGTIADITTNGYQLFVADAAGLKVGLISGTSVAAMGGAAATYVASMLRFVNGWLLAAAANALVEVSAAGAVTTVRTHPNVGFTWNALASTPTWIYAGGQASDVAEIYRIGVNEASGALAVPVYAGGLPRGELLRSIRTYQRSVKVGTSKGLRLAIASGDGSLELGPLIQIGAGQDVWCSYGEGQYVWFGWSNYDGSSTGIGRARLDEFAADLQPAYASDLMYTGAGAVLDVARFGGRTFFAVSGVGFVRQERTAKLVASGTLDMGRFEWGTFEPKTLLGVEIVTAPLSGSLSASVEAEDGTVKSLGTRSEALSTGLGRTLGGATGLQSASLEFTLTLNRDATDNTLGPEVRRVTLRSLASPRQVERWQIPVMAYQTVNLELGDGQDADQDIGTLVNWLSDLKRNGLPVTFQRGNETRMVTVRNVRLIEGGAQRWLPDRTEIEGIYLVDLLSAEA